MILVTERFIVTLIGALALLKKRHMTYVYYKKLVPQVCNDFITFTDLFLLKSHTIR